MRRSRVYVMDCGDFIKIGVSINPDVRKNGIPYQVKRYYSTEPIDNAFEVEKNMHKILRPVREESAGGREYFSADFDISCEILNSLINADKSRVNEIIDAINEINKSEKCKEKFDRNFYKLIFVCLVMKEEDLILVNYFEKGLLARENYAHKNAIS